MRLNYNILLDDFTGQNGSQISAGSHHLRRNVSDNAMFPEIAENAAVRLKHQEAAFFLGRSPLAQKRGKQIRLREGSVIGMLF